MNAAMIVSDSLWVLQIDEVSAVGQDLQARPGYPIGDVSYHFPRDEVVVAADDEGWNVEPA